MCLVYCSLVEFIMIVRIIYRYHYFLHCCHLLQHENEVRLTSINLDLNPYKLRFNCHDGFFLQLDLSLITLSYFLDSQDCWRVSKSIPFS